MRITSTFFLLLHSRGSAPWSISVRSPQRKSIIVPLRTTAGHALRSRESSIAEDVATKRNVVIASENMDATVNSATKNDDLHPVPTGGDFAGLSATFDLKGDLIPVPEYLVPESLLEWGQEPSSLEVLVSEDFVKTCTSINKKDSLWERQTVTVLPETGCGLDNLETTKSSEVVTMYDEDEDSWSSSSSNTFQQNQWVRTFCLPYEKNHRSGAKVEAAFGLPDNHRSRIVVEILSSDDDDKHKSNLCEYEMQPPIRILLERQTNSLESTHGTIADGGGLDAQSVSRLLGETLNRQPLSSFAEKGALGCWVPATATRDEGGINNNSGDDDNIDKNGLMTEVNLAGNLTLAFGRSPPDNKWVLEMGQVLPEKGIRQVIKRIFAPGTLTKSSVETRVEKGQYKL